MKPLLWILFLVFSFSTLNSQDLLNGKVIDATTKTGIPYVNIGIVELAIGTVSDENGQFQFQLQSKSKADQVAFSAIGYETKTISSEALSNKPTVALTPKAYPIPVVEIDATRLKGSDQILGMEDNPNGYAFVFPGIQLGNEVAAPIRIKRPTYIKQAHFKIKLFDKDSILFRIKVYSFVNNEIGANLLTENIIVKHKAQDGNLLTVDMEPYNLVLKSNVLLSIEWISNYGNTNYPGIKVYAEKGKKKLKGIYSRLASMAALQLFPLDQDKNLCFYFVGKPIK